MICLFGSKLGTPTEDYASGSVEEVEEHIKAGKPVMIFFKRILDINNCDIEQITRLKKYKESIGNSALYVDYNDVYDFGKILADKFTLFINSIFDGKLHRRVAADHETPPRQVARPSAPLRAAPHTAGARTLQTR